LSGRSPDTSGRTGRRRPAEEGNFSLFSFLKFKI
jgi:hypothetical protein